MYLLAYFDMNKRQKMSSTKAANTSAVNENTVDTNVINTNTINKNASKSEKAVGSAILYGIGVGPGDPKIMTIKAYETIRSCDVIAIPAVSTEECYAYQIVKNVYPDIANKQIMCTPFPMIKDKKKLDAAHEKIYKDIVAELESGKTVGMLTIGDPSVYSTYMYIHKRVTAAGFGTYMISGVPSFCAAAARLGIPLGEMKEEIHIIPASYDVEKTIGYSGTCVYMKSGKKLGDLIEVLKKAMASGNKMEIYGVTNCGMEDEHIYRGVDELGRAEGYLTIVIVKHYGNG